jgi:phosphatidylinositol dimannoside acyltransferase
VISDHVRFRAADLLARMLPRPAAYALAERIADADWRRCDAKRIAVERNLRRVCSASGRILTDAECAALSRESYRSFARRFVDVFRIGRMTRSRIERLVTIEGLGHLDAALACGRGVIAFSAHLGFNELPGPVLAALGYEVSAVYLPLRDPAAEALFARRRSQRFPTTIPLGSAFRPCLEVLRRRGILAIAADVDYSLRTDLVEFFGAPARLPRGPAYLALVSRAPLVPGFVYRRGDGGWFLHFSPPIVPEQGTTVRDLQERIARALEAGISADLVAWWVFFDFWDVEASLAVSRTEGIP